jgi:hypothetical protein
METETSWVMAMATVAVGRSREVVKRWARVKATCRASGELWPGLRAWPLATELATELATAGCPHRR